MNTRIIESIIKKYDIVSFDIFDTLLKRDVFKPTDVFELVQREYSRRTGKKSEFKKIRLAAEKKAREKSKYQEVTLDDIYEEIVASERNIYKALELEIESSVLHCNYDIKPIFDRALAEGKEIYIISDMYLPRQFLETILIREGYIDFKAIVLSADYRKTKRSGELYKRFLEQYNINAGDVIHIGDSRYADFIGAQKAGIKAIHIQRQIKNTIYLSTPDDSADFDRKSFYAFINTRSSGCTSREEQLGFEVLGPVLFSYCQWIHSRFEKLELSLGGDPERKQKCLWFAARDMYLFKEAYELIYRNEKPPEYMYISRRSLRPILTISTGDISESGNAFPRGECTVSDIIKRMGYTQDDIGSNLNIELKVNPRMLSDYPDVITALSSEKIMRKEKELADTGLKYLENHGFFNSDIVIADVGWHGTTQYILQRILDASSTEKDKKIFGLYLGCLDSTDERIGRDNYQAFAFDEQHDSEFAKGILLFESLILAPHGSTIYYLDEGEKVEPILGKPDNVSDFLKSVQSGALKFVREFKDSVLSSNVVLDDEISTKAFCKLTMEPKKEELQTIGQMDYDDFGIGKMAAPKSLGAYLLHPKQLHYDLKHSPWRIGFLYKLFKIRLPYAKMYSMLRKRQGKQT